MALKTDQYHARYVVPPVQPVSEAASGTSSLDGEVSSTAHGCAPGETENWCALMRLRMRWGDGALCMVPFENKKQSSFNTGWQFEL